MKIEICEQMLQSWLLNCQLCEIVQTNWMISPLRDIAKSDIDQVKVLMKDIQDKLNVMLDKDAINALQNSTDEDAIEEYSLESDDILANKKSRKKTAVKKLNIFKKSTPEQFLRQCEIDVVGTKFNDGVAERIFLVDTAFHKTGLGYHDAVATVLKKIIRAILVSAIIFGTHVPVNVIFAAPKCGDTLKKELETVVNAFRTIIATGYSNITVEMYFNEDFTREIYLPLKANIKKLNNNNDLFMRAMNLASVAETYSSAAAVPPSTVTGSPTKTTTRAAKGENEKIVFGILRDIIKNGKMTLSLLSDLQIQTYANKNFKMPTYPILLKESDFVYSGFDHCRFYKQTISIGSEKYLVCSQWISSRIKLLQDWHKAL